jgi:uncharacterized protein YgiM (DUF1202 family)
VASRIRHAQKEPDMKSGHREQGTAGESGRAGVQQSRQTAPGKVTLTSKLSGRQGAVQRRAAPGAGAAGILSGGGAAGPAEVDWSAAVSLPDDAGGGSAQAAPVQRQEAPVQRQEAVRPPQPAGERGQAGNDPLQVDRGQLTFDAEGTEGGRFHSRRAHWPGGVSGVTIGRGYDLGQHSASQIQADLTQAGISAGDAGRFAGAAGLTGNAARDWLQANRGSLSEITLEQQEALFNIAYARLAGDVERISGNYARTMGQRTGRDQDEFEIDFARLHPAIRDTLVDLRYRGDYTPTTRQRVQPPAIANDLRAMYDVIRDRAYWMQQRGVPEDRFNRRVRFLEAALGIGRQQGTQPQPRGGAAPAEQPAAPGGQPASPNGGAAPAAPPAPEAQPTEPGAAPGAGTAAAPPAPAPPAGAQQPAQQPAGQQAGAPATFTVTASSLNVRSAPDAGSSRLGALRRGERITGTPVGNGWIQITFQSQPAFVSAQHVTSGAGPAQQPQPEQPQTTGNGQRSGAQWVQIANANGWSNTTAFSALDPSWGPRAEAFVNALRAAGASVRITAGLRHPNRAFLMHYAWGVAHGQYTPAQANAACRGRGIDIEWDHGNAAASRAAAQALVSAFGLVHQASITSNHVRGLAIDMEISGLPASISMNGQTYSTRRGASGSAAAASVAQMGRDNGVIWFGAGDYVHWSQNGR